MSVRFWNVSQHFRMLGLAAILVFMLVALAGCQPFPAGAPVTVAKPAPAAQTEAAAATTEAAAVAATEAATKTTSSTTAAAPLVMLHKDAKLGDILADDKGMTLYVFDKDSKDKSACAGDCLKKWPALTVADEKAALAAAEGVTGVLGVIKRDDGSYQVTSNGLPLYYYYEDKQAGDTKGQAVGDVWWVVGADGNKVTG